MQIRFQESRRRAAEPQLENAAAVAFEARRGAADPYTLYLREVGETPLLTPEEEHDLAVRNRAGDKAARERLIKANLRLVVKIARDYEFTGLPLLDLINEGNMGLMKGVDRFDPNRGAKLSTYSSWWIKQHIKRALANQSKTVRLPVHVVDKVAHIRRATMKLNEMLGRDPTDEELAGELGYSLVSVKRYRMAAMQNTSSLDAALGEDETNSLSEIVADEKAKTPFQDLNDRANSSLVLELLETLDPREQRILRERFGFDSDSDKTLEEVGEELGVTRERVRQVQNAALLKLRKKIERIDRVKEIR